RLVVRHGDPAATVARVAAEAEAEAVFVSADFGRYGRQRDDAVDAALTEDGRRLERVGSPYAVDPGVLVSGSGGPFKVFTPFYRAWKDHGCSAPLPRPPGLEARWADGVPCDAIPADPAVDADLPPAGERAARRHLDTFRNGPIAGYDRARNLPGADATSRLSPYLKWGCIHPRQVLAGLGRTRGEETFRTELAWRDFYADVLWQRPESAWRSLRPEMAGMQVDTGPSSDERFAAWAAGRTGYPLVDAGMRQLLGEAWMHNRVRMVVASFLVKDLHIDWSRGARWFLDHLVDGDLASNNHGWQWVAGTGTDPAPYFRVFNPVTQSTEHDPDGTYIRRWVPELAGVDAKHVHEPWKLPGGPPAGYPVPLVDHAAERREALARYAAVRAAQS
ncbi:MAG: DNA photolyase family protein, partial [Actinomycetota bacterium]|nr:DNA photolyase family protein [Actinomycetota bacterium]